LTINNCHCNRDNVKISKTQTEIIRKTNNIKTQIGTQKNKMAVESELFYNKTVTNLVRGLAKIVTSTNYNCERKMIRQDCSRNYVACLIAD